MNIWITSDQHFFDRKAISYNNRPFENTFDGMIDNAIDLFNNFNSHVKKDDLTIFLGDLAFVTSRTKKIFKEMFSELYGTKILVLGNHDKKSEQFYLNAGASAVTDFIRIGRYFLCHYPLDRCFSSHEKHLLELCKHFKCDTIIHGHVHDLDIEDKIFKRINVSVDHNNFEPVKFNQKIFKTFFEKFKRNQHLPKSDSFTVKYHNEEDYDFEPLRIKLTNFSNNYKVYQN